MIEGNSILQKLDGLESRYEEVSTLITDPAVIADQSRYVKLTKEYKDLSDIMNARKRYIACLDGIREAKDILANETDPDMKEMAREELAANEWRSYPRTLKMLKMFRWRYEQAQEAMKHVSSPAISSRCIRSSAIRKDGHFL